MEREKMVRRLLMIKPIWGFDDEQNRFRKGDALSNDDILMVTKPPPDETTDNRGLNNDCFMVTGFSHKVTAHTNSRNPSDQKNSKKNGYNYLGKNYRPSIARQGKRKRNGNRPVWWVLAKDGEVSRTPKGSAARGIRLLREWYLKDNANQDT